MGNNKYEFSDEQLKYINDNWGKESAHSMKLKFGCYWEAVVKEAEKMGHKPPKSNKWTEEDIEQLKLLSEKYHYTVIAKMMDRSENAIYIKAKRLGITLIMDRREWTTAEEKEFRNLWGTVSIEYLAKKMKRSVFSLKVKAIRMKLGAMILNDCEKIIISDIVELLNVKRERITITWKKLGLNIQTTKVSKKKSYMYVTLEDLWDFLGKNQELWDSRELELNILGVEPEWLSVKRKKDCVVYPKRYRKWTDDELKIASDLLLAGKDYEYIASAVNHSPVAVAYKLREIVGSYRLARYWRGQEFIFLKRNYENMEYKEIGEKLGRTTKAVNQKALDLGYTKIKRMDDSDF